MAELEEMLEIGQPEIAAAKTCIENGREDSVDDYDYEDDYDYDYDDEDLHDDNEAQQHQGLHQEDLVNVESTSQPCEYCLLAKHRCMECRIAKCVRHMKRSIMAGEFLRVCSSCDPTAVTIR